MTEDNGISRNVERDFPDYLRDESRRSGMAASISFPKTEEELKNHLAKAREEKMPVTLQGARTGITGGAVPEGGHILSLSRMNKILGLHYDPEQDTFLLTVQPGVLLSELQEQVTKTQLTLVRHGLGDSGTNNGQRTTDNGQHTTYFFPPDPTEVSASIGGMSACNASGARSFFYGPTRKYVERLRVILADGSILDLRRNEHRASGRRFSLVTDTGSKIDGNLPAYNMPEVKNAAGYFTQDNMDLLELFIGSEGTLGIFSEIELRLIPAPDVLWGIMTFFPSEEEAIGFVEKVRGSEYPPVAIEFFGSRALDLLRQQKKTDPAFKEIPDIPTEWHTAIYVEYHGSQEDTVEEAVAEMSEVMTACGGNEEATWAADNERKMGRLKDFRHAVPEAVNLLIDERRKREPQLTKLGTDLAVPDAALGKIMALYHKDLDEAKLKYVMFGHIGNNHIHVNIIPNNRKEYEQGKNLYLEWARTAVAMGGSVSAEHGIGKLKTALLKEMYGEDGIRQMLEVKKLFDPDMMLNVGTLFQFRNLGGH